jgi:heparan sulfate N-deacetylase/N-sulfotransferase NDST2
VCLCNDTLMCIFVDLLDRYMSFFPVPKNATARYLFEKSATYFDGDLVPRRAHALLPHAKLVSY